MTKQNETAMKILAAAESIFLEKGFEGASINHIADKAGINKSLIYHHFESKENLWKTVKANLIRGEDEKALDQITFPTDTFKNFLTAFVTFRFQVYNKNPAIARLIAWQRLEKASEEIQGVNRNDLIDLSPQIEEFQSRGEVRSELDPHMVSYFIISSASAPFMDPPPFFLGKNGKLTKQKYLHMMIDSLYLAFAADKFPKKWLIS